MRYQRTITVAGGLNPFFSHVYELQDIAADTAIFFPANGSSGNKVMAIEPMSMRLQGRQGGDNFSFIRQVEVLIYNPDKPENKEQFAFFRDDIPLNTRERLDLVPNGIDVRKFLYHGKFNLKITLRLREASSNNIDCDVITTLKART